MLSLLPGRPRDGFRSDLFPPIVPDILSVGEHMPDIDFPLGISVYCLSKETCLSQTRLSQIIRGRRSVTAETAVKLGKFFGVAAEFWMNLQSLYDIEEAQKQYSKEIKSIHTIKE